MGLPSSDKATGRINGVICADIKEDDLTKKIQDSLNSGAVYLLDAQEIYFSNLEIIPIF